MGRTTLDHTGIRFEKLLIFRRAPNNSRGAVMWECFCDCGNSKTIMASSLRWGRTTSCGCSHKEMLTATKTTHGRSNTREYRKWASAKERCNPNAHCHMDYFDRGIEMCEEWENDFPKFLAHIGPCPNGMELDRIINSKGYEPGNVRWAPDLTQNSNRRNNRYFTIRGKTLHAAEWSRISGIHVQTILSRIRAGKTPEEAVHFDPLRPM